MVEDFFVVPMLPIYEWIQGTKQRTPGIITCDVAEVGANIVMIVVKKGLCVIFRSRAVKTTCCIWKIFIFVHISSPEH